MTNQGIGLIVNIPTANETELNRFYNDIDAWLLIVYYDAEIDPKLESE